MKIKKKEIFIRLFLYVLLCCVFAVGSPYGMGSVAAMANMLSTLGGPMNMGSMFPPQPAGGAGFNAAQFLQQSKSKVRRCEWCDFLIFLSGFVGNSFICLCVCIAYVGCVNCSYIVHAESIFNTAQSLFHCFLFSH